MEKIRVLIVDDHPLFRQGVRHTLEATKDIEVIGESSGRSARHSDGRGTCARPDAD